jgi:serine/threonine protein kinase
VSTTDDKGHDADPLIGQNIAENRYKIIKIIGEGGMGKVYLGEQKLGDRVRHVAIKTLQPDLAGDPQIVARFHREAGTVSLLDHPNTIKFYESGELPGGKLFVAMEFIQGESLAHSIARGPLAPQRIEHILQQICGSLAEAHEHGIVHRDLKPENIILTQKGSKGDFVKVLDFGIAKRDESSDAQDAKLTRQGMVLGTPPYMSPEQFTGQPLRATSDVYSLAIVVYEMLTGHLPFVASTPWEWATKHLTAPPVPFEMHANGASMLPRHKAAVMRALAKEPAQRPQGVIDFLKEFTGDTGAGADWAVSTNQGHSSQPGQIPPTAMVPQHPSHPGQHPSQHPSNPGQQYTGPQQHTGGPMVPQTMAVNYPTPTPFNPSSNPNFMQPNNQGYTPAPSNAGFNPVQPPPSNPGFIPGSGQGYGSQPNPYASQQGPYGSQPGGYAAMPQQRPSGGGSGKVIAALVALVVIVGGVAAFALAGRNDPAPNNNATNNPTAPTTNPTTQPVGTQPNTLPVQNTVPSNTIQPIPTPNVPSIQPVPAPNNGNDIQPMANPVQPSIQPTAPPQLIRRPSTPCGRESNIDDLIINGRCAQAQSLFRALRSAGCRVSPSDHFGTACAAP